MTNVALTVIGPDRPGLVSAVAQVVAEHEGNWLDSRLAHLAGQFAGVVLVDLPADRLSHFESALRSACASVDLELVIKPGDERPAPTGRTLTAHLVGQDRSGIVAVVSSALADIDVTIDEMTTSTSATPWDGGGLFQATLHLRVPGGVSDQAIQDALEALADELMVDLSLGAEDD
ncbi:glycine cleavage system protein R [Janibacter sp. GXQ6167]|uniref:glycine cleavage system protein R n=1 Tax=Janibacter sp. GXQ6167 TaxID=3240791 RepID=UPI0035236AFA